MARRRFSAEPHVPKYRQVFEALSRDILAGHYQAGQKLPSEAALVQQFKTSRITVGRALRQLVERGLIERIAGSGSYVRQRRDVDGGLLFGLLIPDLGQTEIFEPICRGIAASPRASRHTLIWGHTDPVQAAPEQQALQLCEEYIRRGVSGVFFAPIEAGSNVDETNLAIVVRLEKERIPIVLLDRCILPYPHRCRHDLVGIDNRKAGFIATEHLIQRGTTHIEFIARSSGAPTVAARIAGFQEALLTHGLPLAAHQIRRMGEVTEASARDLMSHRHEAAFVCANDRTAGQLMRALLAIGYRIPQEVRIVGIDDVEYASLLPVALTTVRQPCREIGEAALAAMLDRVESPGLYVRDILVGCELVVRESCGASLRQL